MFGSAAGCYAASAMLQARADQAEQLMLQKLSPEARERYLESKRQQKLFDQKEREIAATNRIADSRERSCANDNSLLNLALLGYIIGSSSD